MTENKQSMTQAQRLELLERDTRDHAKSLTQIIQSVSGGFNPEQLVQLRAAFRDELADAGLRVDEPEHVDDARRDFMFIRALRKGASGFASKIGWAIIFAVLGTVFWLVTQGLNFWKGS